METLQEMLNSPNQIHPKATASSYLSLTDDIILEQLEQLILGQSVDIDNIIEQRAAARKILKGVDNANN